MALAVLWGDRWDNIITISLWKLMALAQGTAALGPRSVYQNPAGTFWQVSVVKWLQLWLLHRVDSKNLWDPRSSQKSPTEQRTPEKTLWAGGGGGNARSSPWTPAAGRPLKPTDVAKELRGSHGKSATIRNTHLTHATLLRQDASGSLREVVGEMPGRKCEANRR